MMTLRQFEPNEEKLKQLILYVSQKCADQSEFGSTKLNKILYFADFIVYVKTGEPLTGVAYQRLQWGPAPRRMRPVLDELVESDELAMQQTLIAAGVKRKKPVNLVAPDLSLFSAAEIAVVDEVIAKLEELTASETSRKSHNWGGWRYARTGQTIPYESAFIDNRPLTAAEHERGLEIARQRGILDG